MKKLSRLLEKIAYIFYYMKFNLNYHFMFCLTIIKKERKKNLRLRVFRNLE